jgi:retron-type reverse transcriptase
VRPAPTAAPADAVAIPAGPAAAPQPPASAPAALKPLQRRLALRDPRVPEPAHPEQHRRRRARVLRGDEARRLFAGTLRTADANLRHLATDEAQLARHGMPVWRSEADLAQALGLTLKTLRHYSIHSARERAPHYVTFAVPKRSGGERLIMAPKSRLKAIQRRLNALLVDKLPTSEHAHGFVAGRSVRSNAQPHVGKAVVLHLDLKDFFPSIHFGRVRGLMIALGYGYPVAAALAALMTESPRQPVIAAGVRYFPPVGARACPQGAPTSPGVSNAIVMKMDRRLAGLARRLGFAYTRYADDLAFSGDDQTQLHALRCLAQRIVEDEGFTLNHAKTRVLRRGTPQRVTGVIVNEVLGLSRQERRRLRAALHRASLRARSAGGPLQIDSTLRGKLAYLKMLNPAQAARLMAAAGSQTDRKR